LDIVLPQAGGRTMLAGLGALQTRFDATVMFSMAHGRLPFVNRLLLFPL
jgi:hypothetical protein